MGCGCKKKSNEQSTQTVKSTTTQTVKEAIKKTVEKYYDSNNKK